MSKLKTKEEIKKTKKTKKRGFTLVELIVVITILAILGTIAFVSFQSYNRSARDGVRLSDLNSIEKSLGIYVSKAGRYPEPDKQVTITYSGGLAWTQGTVGDNVMMALKDINKKPVDPLTLNEYTYSITSLKNEYQVGAIKEGSLLGSLPIDKTYAAGNMADVIATVKGTYNGLMLKVSTGGTDYILAVPSIISSNITDLDLPIIINKRTLVFDDKGNIPSSYAGIGYTMTGGFDYIPTGNVVQVFSGSFSLLNKDSGLKKLLVDNLKQVYNGSILQGETLYTDIIKLDTSDLRKVEVLANNYLQNGIIVPENAIVSTINEYSGCSSLGQILTGSTTYGSCSSADIIVCSGAGIGYTLAACNIGTTIAGTGATSYGNYFQWGNNGGTPYGYRAPTTTMVNASSYGPGNYYNNTTLIAGSIGGWPNITYDWTNPQNGNLWGSGGTVIERQGPCISGYHLPTQLEWQGIITAGGWSTSGINLSNTLKMPMSGIRSAGDSVMLWQNSFGYYWTSTPYSGTAYALTFLNSSSTLNGNVSRTIGSSIRCIKN